MMKRNHLPKIWMYWLTLLTVIFLISGTPGIASTPGPNDTNSITAASTTQYLPLLTKGPSALTFIGADVPLPLQTFEPHTAVVNPLNPQNIVVAAGTNLVISTDFGATFPTAVNPAVPPGLPAGYGFCGDDSLAFDSQGRLFWAYLICADFNNDGTRDDLSAVVQQVNPTTGALVGNAADLTPGNNTDDKTWIAADADPTSPFANNLYVVWTRLNGGSQVMFSRSTDGGINWSAPQMISAAGEGFVWPSHVAVAPNGDVYSAYHGDTCGATTANIFVLRDSNGGADLAGGTAVQKSSFPAAVTCNRQSQPGTVARTDFWMQGAMQPFILPDPVRPGVVYIIANDDPNNDFGSGDPGNVILARTTNDGESWAIKTISHAPNGTLQAFPTGAIDQEGNIMSFWYDTRRGQTNAGGNLLLDVYATVSRDGGNTFTNDFRVNDVAFDPDLGAPCRFGPAANCGTNDTVTTTRIGEYNGAAAANGIGYAAWTGNSATGQQIVFDVFSILGVYADRLEPNNAVSAGVVTSLGSHETYSEPSLTIHTTTDEDFFKLVALNTGQVTFSTDFAGRVSDLDLQVLDKYNPHTPPHAVSGSGMVGLDTADQESITIPVVAGETYFLRVLAQAGQANPFNLYNLNIINRAVGAPFGIGLQIGSDSGRDDTDNVTNIPTATVKVRIDDLFVEGLTWSPVNATATLADDDPGYKVAVYRNGNLAGYAEPIAFQPGDLQFAFPLAARLAEGLNSVTARVWVVDPSDNPDLASTAHMVGRGAESGVQMITLDTIPPAPPSVPDLLEASDSGVSNSDNVTAVNPPAFKGTAESNAIIRIYADGELVGEGVVGSDATDGTLGNSLGAWEVTIEPLADGEYDITARAEDRAGNLSDPSAAMTPPLVLDTPAGGMPQRPTLDLLDSFDTGRSDKDNITYLSTLDFRVSAESGSSVVVKDGNTVIDSFVMPAEAFTIRTLELAEGPHPMSTESSDLAGNTSHQSEELHVTVDLTPPATPAAPDLQPGSDTGGVNVDNITSLDTPTYQGSGEANVIVRLYANGVLSGQGLMTSYGMYQVSTSSLDDGVYDITATYEDIAGNISETSPALRVTVARFSLILPGGTSPAASSDVVINLGNSTMTGFPEVPGGVIGVIGIPVVNLDVNGFALTVLGSPGDDSIYYSPTGPASGSLMNGVTRQVFNFSNAEGDFTIDPLGGVDTVTLNGTASGDTVNGFITTLSRLQVDGLKSVLIPTANTEEIAIATGQSVDTINLTVYDTVNGNVFVHAGEPSNVSQEQDTLNVFDGVGNGKFRNLSGGPTPGSGSLEIYFPFTTNNATRIDYVDVEKMTRR